jgi:hypothetical protein
MIQFIGCRTSSFQSCLHVRANGGAAGCTSPQNVSIHAPAGERTFPYYPFFRFKTVSIHTPRARRDVRALPVMLYCVP